MGREGKRKKKELDKFASAFGGKKKRNSGREIIKNAIRTRGAWEGEER